jgi:hypothetical protein
MIHAWLSRLSRILEDFLTQFLDGNDHTMRLAHLMKIDGALDVGEVWYIRDGGNVTSVGICSPPGVTLRDSYVPLAPGQLLELTDTSVSHGRLLQLSMIQNSPLQLVSGKQLL